jgi:hypothetical protein
VRRKAQDALPDKQLDNLDKVLVSADHLLGLINTILDIAKIEAGRMDVQPATFGPTRYGKIVVASGGNTPIVISGCANRAFGVAITRSPNAASSAPPPIAGPFTTHITGFELSSIPRNTEWNASPIWNTPSDVYSPTSIPPQNILHAESSTISFTSSRSATHAIPSASSRSIGSFNRLWSGRFNVMCVTPASTLCFTN